MTSYIDQKYRLLQKVHDEPKGKSIDTHKGTGLRPGVLDVSKADSLESEYESWGFSNDDDDDQQGDDERTNSDIQKTNYEEEILKDEFVHTPEDYVPTDDETNDVDDEEYRKIIEEMYDDLNVELKDAELVNEDKEDIEMVDVAQVNDEQTQEQISVEHEKINQEAVSAQVQDVAHATTTTAPATQNATTDVPSSSSRLSVSSNYGSIFLNLENLQLAETEIISMLDIKVQHEVPSIHTSPLLIVPMIVIPEPFVIKPSKTVTTAPATNIPLPLPPFFPTIKQSTKATTSTTIIPESTTLSTIHQRVSDLEKEVKILINVDHKATILTAIKSESRLLLKSALEPIWKTLFIKFSRDKLLILFKNKSTQTTSATSEKYCRHSQDQDGTSKQIARD
ncbi:hypothetical protein Tco_0883773 [Tanacetum coccineum]